MAKIAKKKKIKKVIIKENETFIITTDNLSSFVLITNINNKLCINIDNNNQKYII